MPAKIVIIIMHVHQSLPQGNGGWTYEDMIRVNEEKFNVASMYDENMDEYTTPIPEFDEKVRIYELGNPNTFAPDIITVELHP